MKDTRTSLYPNPEVGAKVSEYSDQHSGGLSQNLIEYHTRIVSTEERSNYVISLPEAKYLAWLARTIGAKKVLEIGVFLGFSLMTWAEAVGPENSFILGLESSEVYAKRTTHELDRRLISHAKVKHGDALETLEGVSAQGPFDIIFIDAQKSAYPTYLQTILGHSQPGAPNRLLRSGGLIIADNVLRSGLVVERGEINPASKTVPKQTENWYETDVDKLDEFNKMVHGEERLDEFLMPLFDGLTLARLVD